jgi:hypothetical protein
MPTVPYKWNDTQVDIMLEDAGSDETVRERNVTGFFRGIGVEGLSSGNIYVVSSNVISCHHLSSNVMKRHLLARTTFSFT